MLIELNVLESWADERQASTAEVRGRERDDSECRPWPTLHFTIAPDAGLERITGWFT